MITRIKEIMLENNLTAARFAEKIGVPKSGLSHILSGRNNPSLDYISKILEAFPNVDSEWLILGKKKKNIQPQNEIPTLSRSGLQEKLSKFNKKIGNQAGSLTEQWTNSSKTHQIQEESQENETIYEEDEIENLEIDEPNPVSPKPRKYKNEKPISQQETGLTIERIVIFYTNGKFKEYTP